MAENLKKVKEFESFLEAIIKLDVNGPDYKITINEFNK